MDQTDRSTLKGYFKKGCIPTEEQFAELIDSVPNIVEDGQVKLTEGSWSFYPEQGKPLQVSLFDATGKPAVWTLSLDDKKSLNLHNEKGETVVSLSQKGPDKPDDRPVPKGTYRVFPADKKWHDVIVILPTGTMLGAYQIFACLPVFADRKLKETNVVAYHYGTTSSSLTSSRKHWWGWCGPIKFRWYFSDLVLHLQVRTKKRCGTKKIHLRII